MILTIQTHVTIENNFEAKNAIASKTNTIHLQEKTFMVRVESNIPAK